MRHTLTVIALLLFTQPATADCPDAPDHNEALLELVAQIRGAKTAQTASILSKQMWELWTDAPNGTAQRLLDAGIKARERLDLRTAMSAFNTLIKYCPSFAEGYNQRAFALFIQKDYSGALLDLNMAIELSPTHIPAISGKALTLIGLGRYGEAALTLKDAVDMNPWLPERHLLPKLRGEMI